MKDGWETKALVQVCGFQNGFAFKSKTFRSSGVPVVRITNIKNERVDISNAVQIEKSDYDQDLSKYEVKKGDLLIAMSGATTGKIGINQNECTMYLNQRVGKFVPLGSLSKMYLYYYLLTKVEDNLSISAGSAQPNLSTNQIDNFQIPVPPLAEQEEIVEVLDKAFAAIDQAKANIEKNIENAKELFQSKLNQIFSQKGEGWEECSVGSITGGVSTGPFGSLLHKRDYIEGGIPLVNPAHITDTGIEPDLNKTVTEETASKLQNYRLLNGDIVIARRGEMGRCAIVTERETGWICGTGSFIIRQSEKIKSDYLVRLLRSQSTRDKLEAIAGGAVMKNLSNSSLSDFKIDVPPLPSQQAILVELNELSDNKRSLESIYFRKLTALNELKKSILQKAFAGELT